MAYKTGRSKSIQNEYKLIQTTIHVGLFVKLSKAPISQKSHHCNFFLSILKRCKKELSIYK